ncbi:MAG TPA: hypothetical protein VHB21_02095 [Minicystis sp.]|nr:hypothetical protein [Minicystis sp.]
MTDELKRAFVERLWALAGLDVLEPEAVALSAGVAWDDGGDDPPPPSRRGAWQQLAYSGLVGEPFASVALSWQAERRIGRLSVTPSRLCAFTRAEIDAALVALGAPPGELGAAPAPAAALGVPFESARRTEVVYRVRAGRLRLSFENLGLRLAEIAPAG